MQRKGIFAFYIHVWNEAEAGESNGQKGNVGSIYICIHILI